jgi:hypothetical protein
MRHEEDPMKIRAKTNGNILDLPDEQAQELLATGIYEPDDDGPSASPAAPVTKTVTKTVSKPAAKKTVAKTPAKRATRKTAASKPAPASHPVEPMTTENAGLYQTRVMRPEE